MRVQQQLAMEGQTCLVCNNNFKKKAKGRGYDGKNVTSKLRRSSTTIGEAMAAVFLYKVCDSVTLSDFKLRWGRPGGNMLEMYGKFLT